MSSYTEGKRFISARFVITFDRFVVGLDWIWVVVQVYKRSGYVRFKIIDTENRTRAFKTIANEEADFMLKPA